MLDCGKEFAMTWFEAEQIYRYVIHLENALEEWALSRYQMQSVQARAAS